MTFFNDADLTWMREEVENTLPDTCNILSVTKTSNGQGGFTQSWGTAVASVACRVDAMKQADAVTVVGEAGRVYNRFVVTMPHDTAITAANRIEANGYTLAVETVDPAKSEIACLRAYAYELTEQP